MNIGREVCRRLRATDEPLSRARMADGTAGGRAVRSGVGVAGRMGVAPPASTAW